MTPDLAIHLSSVIVSLGLIIASAENLSKPQFFSQKGLLSGEIASLRYSLEFTENISTLWIYLFSSQFNSILLFVRGISGVILATSFLQGWYSVAALLSLTISHLVIGLRSPYGLDGSYQMSSIILISSCVGSTFFIGKTGIQACVWFICCQSILSYIIAGIAKLASAKWKSGNAIKQIMGTQSYGSKIMYSFFKRNHTVSFLVTWSVILFECLFPLVLAGNNDLLIFFLSLGFVFHVANSVFMGLNGFFWAFVAAYPCIWWCASSIAYTKQIIIFD